MLLVISMKPKPMSHSQNTENSSPHKLRKNNAPIIHGWPGYEMHNGRPLEEQKSNLTKRNLNIYYGGHVGEVAAPNANFFVPKRRKPANLESCYAEKSLKNPIGGTSNEMVDNINEGKLIQLIQKHIAVAFFFPFQLFAFVVL